MDKCGTLGECTRKKAIMGCENRVNVGYFSRSPNWTQTSLSAFQYFSPPLQKKLFLNQIGINNEQQNGPLLSLRSRGYVPEDRLPMPTLRK